jgi:hypothetical protein
LGSGGSLKGSQVTVSENHPDREALIKAGLDAGGDFFTQKKFIKSPNPGTRTISTGVMDYGQFSEYSAVFKGGVLPGGMPVPLSFPASGASSNADLDKWGTRAIALCSPTNQTANLLTALIELYHDKLPHLVGAALWRAKTLTFRKGGEEYLNWQFGYKPLANDIASFANGVADFDRLCKQYERDAGRIVRRRFSFPPQSSYDSTRLASSALPVLYPMSSDLVDLQNPARGATYRESRVTTRRWFSGAFSYWLPDDFYRKTDFEKHVFLANKLLGIHLDPETVWNVAPWSWAVDWFTNAGNVIHNVSQLLEDSLIVRWGYVMEHTIAQDTYYQLAPSGFKGGVGVPDPLILVTATKQRRRATPFGFGTLLTGLTARQKAIMAAIGSTRH